MNPYRSISDRGGSDQLARTRRAIWSAAGRTRWWYEVLLVAGLYLVYDLLRASVGVAEPRAERNGFTVLRWEKSVHVDPEHLMNHLMTGAAYLAVPACFFYAAAYLIVTPAVLIWTYRRRSAAYCRARTILAVITATALLGFWIYPTAPPRLLIGGGFADTLAVYRSWGWWGGADSVPAGMKSISNQFAAMPSLHVAWSLWCAFVIIAQTQRRVLRTLAAAYPIVTVTVVLGTANHYLLDALAGALLWLTATAVVSIYRPRAYGLQSPPAAPARIDSSMGTGP